MSETKNLSEQLAARVADKLIETGLLRQERKQAMITELASGKMKPEAWKVHIELALDKNRQS